MRKGECMTSQNNDLTCARACMFALQKPEDRTGAACSFGSVCRQPMACLSFRSHALCPRRQLTSTCNPLHGRETGLRLEQYELVCKFMAGLELTAENLRAPLGWLALLSHSSLDRCADVLLVLASSALDRCDIRCWCSTTQPVLCEQ
jgi:hypothetical protein